MELKRRIEKSEKLIRKLDQIINGLEVSSNRRARFAGGCLNLASEYHKAIITLIAHKIYGPALAQARLILEAYVRGVWLHKCALENDLSKFQNDKLKKSYAEILTEVEKLPSHTEGVLSRAKSQNWRMLNSYTHCGYHQVVRQNKENSIESNFDDEELFEAIDFTNALGMLAAIAMCDLAGADEMAVRVLDEAKRYNFSTP